MVGQRMTSATYMARVAAVSAQHARGMKTSPAKKIMASPSDNIGESVTAQISIPSSIW